jgi:hypothetical protein
MLAIFIGGKQTEKKFSMQKINISDESRLGER